MSQDQTLRVRFAPSPTGYLHVGGARTAIFNYLIARKMGGVSVLRFEDTDQARSSQESVDLILDSLRWLGVEWDEGPFFQSQRSDLYRRRAEELLSSGSAYRCYCTKTELDVKKGEAEAAKETYRYDRTCLRLPAEERERLEKEGRSSVVRVRIPDGATAWEDIVQGTIEVQNETIDDFVLLRSDGSPTYQLTVVVDDIDMGITHVLRGTDHVSNTPKQILLYRALGPEPPRFGHMPLILGPDKKKLSKRHGQTSVGAYREEGILPEALFNFLALLGWSPGDDRELMTREELIDAVSFEGMGRSNAVFDRTKLEWMNAQYISRMPRERLADLAAEELRVLGLWQDELAGERRPWWERFVEAYRTRARVVADIAREARPFLTMDFPYEPKAAKKRLKDAELPVHLEALREAYAALDEFSEESTDAALRSVAEERGINASMLIHALRVGLTGQGGGPSLFELVALQGREGTLARMDRLLAYLGTALASGS